MLILDESKRVIMYYFQNYAYVMYWAHGIRYRTKILLSRISACSDTLLVAYSYSESRHDLKIGCTRGEVMMCYSKRHDSTGVDSCE